MQVRKMSSITHAPAQSATAAQVRLMTAQGKAQRIAELKAQQDFLISKNRYAEAVEIGQEINTIHCHIPTGELA